MGRAHRKRDESIEIGCFGFADCLVIIFDGTLGDFEGFFDTALTNEV